MYYWLLEESVFQQMEKMYAQGNIPTVKEQEDYVASINAAVIDNDNLPRIMTKSGDSASIQVNGVLTNAPDLFARWFGGGNTTFSEIRGALAIAEADPAIKKAEILIDSPGGHASAEWVETMDAIAAFSKPITAVVGNLGASAAYGLASQADEIQAQNRMSRVGSVGVVASFFVSDSVIEVTSSGAPDKRPDVTTDEGKAVVRKQLDAMEKVFMDSVAQGRDVTVEDVKSNFGRGGTVLANEAIEKGMIDGIVAGESTPSKTTAVGGKQTEAINMDLDTLKAEHPGVYAAAVAAGVQQERDRVEAHVMLGEDSGDLEAALKGIKEGEDPSNPKVVAAHAIAAAKKGASDARSEELEEGAQTGQTPATATKSEELQEAEALEALIGAGAGENGEFF